MTRRVRHHHPLPSLGLWAHLFGECGHTVYREKKCSETECEHCASRDECATCEGDHE